MKNQFTIASAYEWKKNDIPESNSEKAIKHIVKMIVNRFSHNIDQKNNFNINYRRLRASAGRTMLESIFKRIKESQVIIIDISTLNRNVFLEAGIALALEIDNPYLSVYFIREQNENFPLPSDVPSDLQGYFISEYVLDLKGQIVFKDNNSLRMSIESDIKEYFNSFCSEFYGIDEVNDEI